MVFVDDQFVVDMHMVFADHFVCDDYDYDDDCSYDEYSHLNPSHLEVYYHYNCMVVESAL